MMSFDLDVIPIRCRVAFINFVLSLRAGDMNGPRKHVKPLSVWNLRSQSSKTLIVSFHTKLHA